MTGLRLLPLFVMMASCGNDALFQKYEQAARKQDAVDSNKQELFMRSPLVDSQGQIRYPDQDPDRVPRTIVELVGLESQTGPLESQDLKVFSSSRSSESPTFFEWAGRRIPWDNSDFQIFMAYFHGQRAIDYYRSISFQPLDWGFLVNTGSSFVSRLSIFSSVSGSPFDTGYDFTAKEISFFRQPTGVGANYNPVDEADAIYHEVAHVAMHALRPAVVQLEPGLNTDLDSIQEGLADFLGAALAGDDAILTYFSANAVRIFPPDQSRTRNQQQRGLASAVAFPRAYRDDIYLDGKVMASALNDFRKYLNGENLRQITNCSGSGCSLPMITTAVSKTEAFAAVSKLSLAAFGDLVESSTLQEYARILVSYCSSQIFCPWPGSSEILERIFIGRGLLSISDTVSLAAATDIVWSADPAVADILTYSDLGFLEFPGDPGFSNENGIVEPCEVLLVYPKIRNNTQARGRPLDLRNIRIELGGVTGFSEVRVPGSTQPVERIRPSGSVKPQSKFFGWLSHTESGWDSAELVASPQSPWYQEIGGSVFAQRISATSYPSAVGWLVRAPASPGGVASAQFRIQANPYNTSRLFTVSHDNPNVLEDTFLRPNGVDFPSLQVSQAPAVSFCSN